MCVYAVVRLAINLSELLRARSIVLRGTRVFVFPHSVACV
jgi:hypothetical protein